MPPRHATITFLSDYGRADEFVGVVHSVIRCIAPEVVVIDLAHDIEPHDVRGGGLLLARSAQYLAPGVVLAVVDPGVGTDRRGIAIEVGGGQSYLVGPDNGLLAPAVSMVGGADRAVALTSAEHQLESPGPTFAGRDVFAPAAAHLALGVDLYDLGEPVDPITLLPGVLPVSHEKDGWLVAEVLWVDRFGNAQLNIDPDELAGWGERVRLRAGEQTRTAMTATAYAGLKVGEVGLVVDSYGMLSIAVDRGSAADELRVRAGDQVMLARFEGDDDIGPGVTTSVTLGPRTPR
jgi:S-adenosylmethionine hydrolase